VTHLLQVLLKVLGKPFSMLEILSIGPTFIHSPEVLDEAIGVEASTAKFTNNCVSLGLQFLPERRVIICDLSLYGTCREDECFSVGNLWNFIDEVEQRLMVFSTVYPRA